MHAGPSFKHAHMYTHRYTRTQAQAHEHTHTHAFAHSPSLFFFLVVSCAASSDCKKRVWAVAEVVTGQRPVRRSDNRVTAMESFAQVPLGSVRVCSTQAAFLLPSVVRIHTRGQRNRCVLLQCPEPPLVRTGAG